MCGRFNLGEPMEETELRDILRSAEENTRDKALLAKMKTSGEIRPTNVAPVVLREGAVVIGWGMPLFDGKYPNVINSRDDKLTTNREYLRMLAAGQRCLVPIGYYYEWHKADPKNKIRYRFQLAEEPLMYLAGLYKVEAGVPQFTIITTQASATVRWIYDRMPLILPEEARGEWLMPGGAAEDVVQYALRMHRGDATYQEDDDRPRQMRMF